MKFEKRNVHTTFKDNVWGADLADMRLTSKLNKGIRFLLCVIHIYSKYGWVITLKDKNDITITNAFQEKILNWSGYKPNKIWADKGSKFHNRLMKSLLQYNNIEVHSTNNEVKSDVAERFIRTLKNKIFKCMTSISKNMYIDKLDKIVNKYNNTYHSIIQTKPADVKDNTYTDFDKKK